MKRKSLRREERGGWRDSDGFFGDDGWRKGGARRRGGVAPRRPLFWLDDVVHLGVSALSVASQPARENDDKVFFFYVFPTGYAVHCVFFGGMTAAVSPVAGRGRGSRRSRLRRFPPEAFWTWTKPDIQRKTALVPFWYCLVGITYCFLYKACEPLSRHSGLDWFTNTGVKTRDLFRTCLLLFQTELLPY